MTQSDRTASGRATRPEIPRHLQVLTVPGLEAAANLAGPRPLAAHE